MSQTAFSLSRKEGWRRYVEALPRSRPPKHTLSDLAAMGPQAREDYAEARHDWHANFGILRTPQLAGVHEELDLIVAANRQDSDRIRGAAVIDALPGLGKTTIANVFARGFDRNQIRRGGPRTAEGHERIPVFRVGLTSNTTLRTLNRMICQFYGHPGLDRANAAQLASHALDCVLSCETRLGIIDDVHFINPARRDGLDVSNHLKWLANELPITFIYVGVGLSERRFFAEGMSGDGAIMAQTARRWTRLQVATFEVGTDEGRRDWAGLLKSSERQLVLANARPGMLTALSDYLFARTSGHIGSFITLLTRGCYLAISRGSETISVDLLDQVRIDEASEQARQQLSAAFDHGRLSSTTTSSSTAASTKTTKSTKTTTRRPRRQAEAPGTEQAHTSSVPDPAPAHR